MNQLLNAAFVGGVLYVLAILVTFAKKSVYEAVKKRDGKWFTVFAIGVFYSALAGSLFYVPSVEREGGDRMYDSGEIIDVSDTPESKRQFHAYVVFFLGVWTTIAGIRSEKE